MAPGAKSKFGAPMVEVWRPNGQISSFEGKFTVLKKVLVTLLGLFGALAVIQRPHSELAPGESRPLSLRPWLQDIL